MTIKKLSLTITTHKLHESRSFFKEHFGASAVFDCGWYVVLRLQDNDATEICLMEPQDGMPEFSGGLTVNLQFESADAVYENLNTAGLQIVMPLEDHPWGDRGFGVMEPSGAMIYCYHEIPPSEDFKSFFSQTNS